MGSLRGRARVGARALFALLLAAASTLVATAAGAQSFSTSNLDFDGKGGVFLGTAMAFGPDGRLYVLQIDGTIDVFSITRQGPNDYVVTEASEISSVRTIPNHDDDGSPNLAIVTREATGITVAGTATNPVIYATSSDSRVGGPSGDTDLDTNSGVITRLSWVGDGISDPLGYWDVVDIVRGLPRSEENHATNAIELVSIAGTETLVVASGGHTNAGSPSTNFAWHTEYALSAAVLAIDLAAIEALPILSDGGRQYSYDLPTVDDPTRANANGISDPNAPGYDGVDVDDPFGGNDGLNQAKLVPGGPVQILSPGYRNTYDFVITQGGALYVTDNGGNQGWGGFPENEGLAGTATNDYRVGEPGSSGPDLENGDLTVSNNDHLSLVTTDLSSYVLGSFYGGHPNPIRSNPAGAGLFTRGVHSSDPGDSNGNGYGDDWFRTLPYDPNAVGDAADPMRALPADWPPVPLAAANPIEGDYRDPLNPNPDGPADAVVAIWPTNTNGITEYTASNFAGAMQGNLIAGRSGGNLHRVELLPDGSLDTLTVDWVSGIGGNPLAIVANGDTDPFAGSIWVATFNDAIVILEPQDFVVCLLPGDPGYSPTADNDFDGYSNSDELDNGVDPCNGAAQPGDFDKAAGAPLLSNLNDLDDDADGVNDEVDPLQFGDPLTAGSDAFGLPVVNELFSDNPALGGYLGLGVTGLMNNGDANPNWQDWLDVTGAGPNPNDILGGAVGAMTMQMTEGSAAGAANDQVKGFQYGVDVDTSTVGFHVRSRLLNFDGGHQLYPFAGDGELGIQIGDGTQSNFIQIVLDHDGVEARQEIGDVPQSPLGAVIAPLDRPTASIEFEFDVDAVTGSVEALYAIDGGAMSSLGSIAAEGPILQAIQDPAKPLIVGMIGTSNTPGAEVEGTWDYLNVIGYRPSVALALPLVSDQVGSAPLDLDLDDYFDDDDGDANLSYSVESVSNPAFGASIAGDTLTLQFAVSTGSAQVVIRATDGNGLFVEQTLTIEAVEPIVIYRVNAGGTAVAAIDGGIDWSGDTTGSPSPYLENPGSNQSASFNIPTMTPEVDPITTPLAIFQNERWNQSQSQTLRYAFPIATAGHHEVRIYMANGYDGTNDPGERIFSVAIEGVVPPDLEDIDLSAEFGHQVGGVLVHTVLVTDGSLDIEFVRGPIENPLVNGLEIIAGVTGAGGPGGDPPPPAWIDLPEDESYVARHECSFVQAGDRFFMFGGRESPSVLDTYDYAADSWSTSASAPLAFNHFQAVEHAGLIWVIGAFKTNDFPNELPAEHIYSYDPANDVWMQGPEIPVSRRRGSTGLVVHDDKFYIVGGNTIGHNGGYQAWFDEYDPATGIWTPLVDAPRARDHFHAAVANGKLYVAGGRLSGGEGGVFAPLIPEVDVYDFGAETWSTLAPASNLPTPRAAAAVAVFDGEILVIGGEGNGQAYATVEALDPTNDTWRTLDALNHARHGTQAIVSGEGVYIAGGSPNQGGGNQKNMEVYNADVPAGTASSAGLLNAPLNVPFTQGVPEDIQLDHVAGNTGSFVQALELSGIDAADFTITNPIADAFLIPVAGNHVVNVEYTGVGFGATASLDVSYAGGDNVNVVLVPEPGALLGLGAGLIGLAMLQRRRRRHAPEWARGGRRRGPGA